MQKYDRKIIARNKLADLEHEVFASMKEDWELDDHCEHCNLTRHSPTIVEALSQVMKKEMVAVTMKRRVELRREVQEVKEVA